MDLFLFPWSKCQVSMRIKIGHIGNTTQFRATSHALKQFYKGFLSHGLYDKRINLAVVFSQIVKRLF